MKQLLEKYPLSIVTALATLITGAFWHKVLLSSNGYLLGAGGDGIKNYYTSLYYIKYGEAWHFNGMWYPYGEHVLYTDNIPILSYLLRWIHVHVMPIADKGIGIINLLVLASIILGIMAMYLILRHYRISKGFAIICALLIGFMAPQMHRITGHYSLAFMHFFPTIWYLLIRLQRSKKPLSLTIVLTCTMLIFGFIHSYYLLIGGAFLVAYAFLQAISTPKNWKYWGGTLTAALIPVIIFQLVMISTDSSSDRHPNPYGLLKYTTQVHSVFLPTQGPMYEVVNNLFHYKPKSSEGWAYIGIIGTLTCLLLLFQNAAKAIRKRQWKPIIYWRHGKELALYFGAAIMVLVFAFGVPFKLLGKYVDYLPSALKQFRTLGRFAIVFYYVFSVVSALFLYKVYRSLRLQAGSSLAGLAISLALLVWSYEAFSMLKYKWKQVKPHSTAASFYGEADYPNPPQELAQKNYSSNDFQAILPIPYYNIGSEELYLERSGSALYHSCKLSYTTGLPIATGYLSRTSFEKAYKLGQLLSSPFIDKSVLADFNNDKPLLLLVSNEKLTPRETYLLKQAEYITNLNKKKLYKLPLSAFNSKVDSLNQVWSMQQQNLVQYANYSSPDSLTDVLILPINNVDKHPNFTHEYAFSGQGAAYLAEKGDLALFDGKLPNAQPKQGYTASVWTKVDGKKAAFTPFILQQWNEAGELLGKKEVYPKQSTEYYQGWVRVHIDFNLDNKHNRVKLSFYGKHSIVDELWIQPQKSMIYSKRADGQLLYNNYVLQDAQ